MSLKRAMFWAVPLAFGLFLLAAYLAPARSADMPVHPIIATAHAPEQFQYKHPAVFPWLFAWWNKHHWFEFFKKVCYGYHHCAWKPISEHKYHWLKDQHGHHSKVKKIGHSKSSFDAGVAVVGTIIVKAATLIWTANSVANEQKRSLTPCEAFNTVLGFELCQKDNAMSYWIAAQDLRYLNSREGQEELMFCRDGSTPCRGLNTAALGYAVAYGTMSPEQATLVAKGSAYLDPFLWRGPAPTPAVRARN